MVYFEDMNRLIFIVTLTAVLASGITSYADIYKYVDENGVVHFTNIPAGKGYKKIISSRQRHKSTIPSHYNKIIHSKSRKYNVEPSLVKAVIKIESDGNSAAVSRKGAMGLMQLMPSTAKEMNVKNPFNPEENIEGGTRYLRYLLDKFNGDLTLALAAYNAGPKTIEKFGGMPPIQETRQYVRQILSIYSGNNSSHEMSTPIYKIIFNDGSVLYTNIPRSYEGSKPSRF